MPKETGLGGNDGTGLPEYLWKGLPQGCRDKQKKLHLGGVEEEVRAVHLRCLHVFWHKHRSGLSQRRPVSFLEWGQLLIQPLLTLGPASQHRDGKEDAQGHREVT